ncbi:MAG: 50S ribosomal protein L6 [Candidatus Schekmanbacteria bacterium]|nr:MAG: 50S ribosomal protein L6 [Candidatus Schekmanbacteria bacterium]
MSRIGKKPILFEEGVSVEVKNREVHVKGPLGKSHIRIPEGISVKVEAGQILVNIEDESIDKMKAKQGLVRSLVNNMVIGVTKGFQKKLQIVGVGYKSQVQGKELVLNIGFSHPVNYKIPEGIKIEVDKQTEITVSGIDKQAVGQTAAEIRGFYPPEPYKGKGIRYADEYVRTKVGKTGA